MMPPRRLVPVVLWAMVAAGCAATTPSPSANNPTTSTRPPAATSHVARDPTPEPESNPVPSASPSMPGRGPLEIEIGEIDPSFTTPLLQVASDGTVVLFSSGVSDGDEGVGAPDLYRYVPGRDAPELLWRNPRRERELIPIGGENGTYAFVDSSAIGERSWNLWVLPNAGGQAILLDQHPGDDDVSSLAPSFDVEEGRIAWSAFDAGPDGPVSELWLAEAPDWQPRLLESRLASERELWLPSLLRERLAYVEVIYDAERASDERHVLLADLTQPDAEPQRLDTTGRATMPIITETGVLWKETDSGFNMFNWGALQLHDFETAITGAVSMIPQHDVNYPSAGNRFVAAWGTDVTAIFVHDLESRLSRRVEQVDRLAADILVRPHVSGDLLVWIHGIADETGEQDAPSTIRWAWLPEPGSDIRGR